MGNGSWLMAQGNPAGAPRGGGGGPEVPAGLPGDMSHEPLIID